mgnify:FL=1
MKEVIEKLLTPGDSALAANGARCLGPSVKEQLAKNNSAHEPELTEVSYEFL